MQLTLSAYLIGFAVGQIAYGPFSDRHGRKPVLLAALVLFSLGNVACTFAPSIEMLIAARTLQALGGSGAIVVARAIVRDLYAGARAGRELSLMGAIMALAPIVAPLIGGVLQTAFGWRASFLVALCVGLAATAIVWRLLPETLRERAPEPVSLAERRSRLPRLDAEPRLPRLSRHPRSSFAGLFAWISGSSFVLQDIYRLSPLGFGLAFAVCSVGFMIGALLASDGRAPDRA